MLQLHPSSRLKSQGIQCVLDLREVPNSGALIVIESSNNLKKWLKRHGKEALKFDLHFWIKLPILHSFTSYLEELSVLTEISNSDHPFVGFDQKAGSQNSTNQISSDTVNFDLPQLDSYRVISIPGTGKQWSISCFSSPLAALQDMLKKGEFIERQTLSSLEVTSESYSAFIHPTAQVHSTAVIEGYVDAGTIIGPQVWIGENSYVGQGAQIDAGVKIYPRVSVGSNCHIYANAVLGSDGFGYNASGAQIPHLAGVKIGDRVNVGPQSVVASGCLLATQIGSNTQLDSFVQIGHHAILGQSVFMASQSGVGGSSTLGDGVAVAGGAQIKDHVCIGPGAKIAAKAGIIKDVPAGETYAGFPAMPIRAWHRQNQTLKAITTSALPVSTPPSSSISASSAPPGSAPTEPSYEDSKISTSKPSNPK